MHGQSLVFSDHKKGVHHDYISMLMTWKEWGKGVHCVPNRWILSRAELKFNQAKALFCARSVGTEVLISTYETSVQSETVEYHITIQQRIPCIAFPMSRRGPGFLLSFSLMRLTRTL